jgi:hypothetical protein
LAPWRPQIILMLVLAVVMMLNVAIWALPDTSGNAPLTRTVEAGQQVQER